MAVDVFAADEQGDVAVDIERWARLARSVLESQAPREEAEVSLLFVDEETMSQLRERFMGEDGPTDVLAFPIDEEPEEGGRSPDEGGTGPGGSPEGDREEIPMLLGDVVVCPKVAERNARTEEVELDDELALLVVHGLLHLLGMDHEEEEEAERMERKEQQLLARFHRVLL